VRAYPEQPFIGKITAINPDIDKTTRSIIIRATLLNPNQRLRPGMFVDVKILSETGRSVITVPDTSITYNPYGDSVFVVKPGKEGLMVELRQITTGETRQGRVEILNGLAENERIVSAGQVKLRNGVPVTLDTKAAPGERRQQE
jgi:membrane fusion protein (multidrug efflux system)